jgi:hypothetical protein
MNLQPILYSTIQLSMLFHWFWCVLVLDVKSYSMSKVLELIGEFGITTTLLLWFLMMLYWSATSIVSTRPMVLKCLLHLLFLNWSFSLFPFISNENTPTIQSTQDKMRRDAAKIKRKVHKLWKHISKSLNLLSGALYISKVIKWCTMHISIFGLYRQLCTN